MAERRRAKNARERQWHRADFDSDPVLADDHKMPWHSTAGLRDELLAVKGFLDEIMESAHCLPSVTIEPSLSDHDSDGR